MNKILKKKKFNTTILEQYELLFCRMLISGAISSNLESFIKVWDPTSHRLIVSVTYETQNTFEVLNIYPISKELIMNAVLFFT